MDEKRLKTVFDLIELYHEIQHRRAAKDFLKKTKKGDDFIGAMKIVATDSEIHTRELQFKRLQVQAEEDLRLYSRQKNTVNPLQVNHMIDGTKYIAYLTAKDTIEIKRG